MGEQCKFLEASPYQDDVLALPVTDLDAASEWYCSGFGMVEAQRQTQPHPKVILERDGVQLGFEINGGDASQDGAALLVQGIEAVQEALIASGVKCGDLQDNERDGQQFRAFFVVAPDGLCYYFHEQI